MTDDPKILCPRSPEPSTNGHSPAAPRRCAPAWPTAATRCSRASATSARASRVALRDPLSLFLLLASIGLAITFAVLLGEIRPSQRAGGAAQHGAEARAHHQIANAALLDHDSRVEITTTSDGAGPRPPTGRPSRRRCRSRTRRASRPGGTERSTARRPDPGAVGRLPRLGRADPAALRRTRRSGAVGHGRPAVGQGHGQILVQFLIPILLLVCLFALFMRLGADGGAGGIAALLGVHRQGQASKGKGTADRDHVRRRRRRRRGGGRAARDPRLPRRPVAST